jgi:surface antigen
MPTQAEIDTNMKNMANKLGQWYNATTGQMIDTTKPIVDKLPEWNNAQRDANINIRNQATADKLGQTYNVDTQQFEAGPTALEIQRNKEQAAFNQKNPVWTRVEDIKYTPESQIADVQAFKPSTTPVTTPQATTTSPTSTTPVKTQKNESSQTSTQTKQEPTIDYNSSIGREDQIGNNLATITTQTPELLIDRTKYDRAFGYSTADEGKKALLDSFFASGKKNIDNVNTIKQYAGASVNELSASLLDGSMSPYTKSVLMSDPILSAKIKKADELNRLNNKKVDNTAIGEKQTAEILATKPTIASALENGELGTDEVNALTSSPEQIALKKKRDIEFEDLNKKTAIWDSIENDVNAKYAGSGATASDVAQIIANARKALLPELNRAERAYNNTTAQLTELKKEALWLLETNLGLYKEQKAAEAKKEDNLISSIQDQLKFAQTNGIPMVRSDANVILADAKQYAKENGVTIEQAIKDTFTTPFTSKKEYGQAMVNIQNKNSGAITPYEQASLDLQKQKLALDGKITQKDIIMENSKRELAGLPPLGQTTESIDQFTTTRKDKNGNQTDIVQCGALVNDYWKSVTGISAGIGDTLNDKYGTISNIGRSEDPQVGSIFVSNPLKNWIGHTGIVSAVNPDGSITVREANREGSENGGKQVTHTYSSDKVEDMRFSIPPSNSLNKEENSWVLKTILGSGKFTKEQKKSITEAITNGEDAAQVIKNNAKNLLTSASQTKLENYETARNTIEDFSNSLKEFYAAGGDTGIFSGNYEKVINKLGEVDDPNLVTLATEIAANLQVYRNAVSGTAYSVKEGDQIESIFPWTNKWEVLNNSIIKWRLKALDSTVDWYYAQSIWKDSWKKIKEQLNTTDISASSSDEELIKAIQAFNAKK